MKTALELQVIFTVAFTLALYYFFTQKKIITITSCFKRIENAASERNISAHTHI
jgi:hypothetical protein